jgi:hypothetical protein
MQDKTSKAVPQLLRTSVGKTHVKVVLLWRALHNERGTLVYALGPQNRDKRGNT